MVLFQSCLVINAVLQSYELMQGFNGSPLANLESKPVISFLYVGKIVLAFALIFVLGAIFTLALENLPRLISILS